MSRTLKDKKDVRKNKKVKDPLTRAYLRNIETGRAPRILYDEAYKICSNYHCDNKLALEDLSDYYEYIGEYDDQAA